MKSKHITVRIEQTIGNQLEAQAKKENRSVSNLIQHLIKTYLIKKVKQ